MYSGTKSYVLRLIRSRCAFCEVASQLPFEPVHGLDIDRMGAPVSLATAAQPSIYIRPHLSDNWLLHRIELPPMPYCSDLGIGVLEGRRKLYLSPWGSRVWVADIDAKGRPNHQSTTTGRPVERAAPSSGCQRCDGCLAAPASSRIRSPDRPVVTASSWPSADTQVLRVQTRQALSPPPAASAAAAKRC